VGFEGGSGVNFVKDRSDSPHPRGFCPQVTENKWREIYEKVKSIKGKELGESLGIRVSKQMSYDQEGKKRLGVTRNFT
jgi:hypothetical protein